MSFFADNLSFIRINFKEKNKKKNPKTIISEAAGTDKLKLPEYDVAGIKEMIIVHNV